MDIPILTLKPEDKSSQVSYLKQFSVTETFRLHTHDFYELFYICKGKSLHEINSSTQLLTKGALVFIRPKDVHKFDFFNNYDMHIISCGVEETLIEYAFRYLEMDKSIIDAPLLPPAITLEGAAFSNMEAKLDLLDSKAAGKERRTYFLSLLPELIYLFCSESEPLKDPLPFWLATLLSEMSEPENFISGLPAMLQLAHFSQEHLTREFRKHLHMTPTEFINAKRINYAASLLLEHKYDILDVCYMSGFHNLTYFYKIFKKHYHCTPKEFL